ncbi:MAG TPA: hypothetical protein PKX00_18775 [Opitutaceae bacterium]|jgi:hypothetical protein|nr:hypothetical protein [Opitutaceae bacterium]HRE07667.1 hypothetical protein [Opitutaceae bacterium]
MKTALLRFLVRWYQASDQNLPPWLDRACQRTPSLAATLQEEALLSSRLRAHPRQADIAPSPFLKSKVLHTLTREAVDRDETAPAARWTMPSAAVAGALALVLLLAAVWLSREPAGSGVSDRPALAAVTPHPTPLPAPVSVAQQIPQNWANPLDAEMASVVADADRAVRFLASAFLPSESVERRLRRPTSG